MNSEMKTPKSEASGFLTPAGQARRESMRDRMHTEFVRLHQRRNRNRKAVAWSAAATAVLISVGMFWLWPDRFTGSSSKEVAVQPNQPVEKSNAQVELVKPETETTGIEFELINDDQLLDMLAEVGQPSALAWIGGKQVLIPLRN